MKSKLLFTAITFVMGFQLLQAQYLVSATQMEDRTIAQIQTVLDNGGWDTNSMVLNPVISYSITYNTTDVLGNPTIASGALYVPQLCDVLPLVSYQHGTQFNSAWVPSTGYFEDRGLLYAGNGFITTLPDYLGMGVNAGMQHYFHSETEATASIDLIRASKEFLLNSLQISVNDQIFLSGISQGGHATMAVHKYIADHNLENEFNVVASAPMSGPYDLSMTQMDFFFEGQTYPVTQFVVYLFASYQNIYGNLYPSYDYYYDPPYDAIIENWITNGTAPPALPSNYYEFMQDSVVDNIVNNPNHPTRVDASYNDVYNWSPQESVRMLYCALDNLVTFENATLTEGIMNGQGAPDVEAIDVFTNGDHFTCFIPATTNSLDWFNSLKVQCPLSVPDIKTPPKIMIYPNPIQSHLMIASDVPIVEINIREVTGRSVFELANSTNIIDEIDVSFLHAGIYFITLLTDENQSKTIKLIKK